MASVYCCACGAATPACGFSVARAAEQSNARTGRATRVTFAGGRDLLGETRDHATRRVVLVEGVTQLLSRRLQLLPQREAVQHHGVLERRW